MTKDFGARASSDPAVVVGSGADDYNALLERVHESMWRGGRAPASPRPVIAESWRRLRGRGIRPDRNSLSASATSAEENADTEQLRSLFRAMLPYTLELVDDAAGMLVVSDATGRIVEAAARGTIRDRADEIGFMPGHSWHEHRVGTNAIGTALVVRRPVAVHGAEHYLLSQHGWSCAAAPLRDPWTGTVLGAVDLSVCLQTAHPALLSLASSLARTAGLEIASRHRADLERLRTAAVAATRAVPGSWVVVDRWGWVADSHHVDVPGRIALPTEFTESSEWLPIFGAIRVRPLPGGWLIEGRSDGVQTATTTIEIVNGAAGAHVELRNGDHRRNATITPRQAEILTLLTRSPAGLTAAELSARLYGTPERDVTVRAAISRMRRQLGAVLVAAPYRFAPGVLASIVVG